MLMGCTEREDIEFWTYMLRYWKEQTKVDDLEHWKDHQLEYFSKHSQIDKDINLRRKLIKDVAEAVSKKVPQIRAIMDEGELNHWYSVIKTRNHGISYK
jgi:hypothetical protein